MPDAKSLFVISWTGMRGVVALAAAFSLPKTLGDGRPFEQRNLILFLTFSIILVTLVLQGLTLPPLIRRLGLDGNRETEHEELWARRKILEQAIAALQNERASASEDEVHDIDDILRRYRHQLEAVPAVDSDSRPDSSGTNSHPRRTTLLRDPVAGDRRTLQQLRDAGSIGDVVLRRLERELDLTETRYENPD